MKIIHLKIGDRIKWKKNGKISKVLSVDPIKLSNCAGTYTLPYLKREYVMMTKSKDNYQMY